MENIVARRIETLLCEKNMSQRESALKVGVTEVTISRYLHSDRNPRSDIVALISKALDTTTDYLLGRTDDKREKIYEGEQVSQELKSLGVKMFSILGDLSEVELNEIKKFAEYVRSKRDK